MDLSALFPYIKAAAPTLATALGGPGAGAIAAILVPEIGKAIGLGEDATPEEIAATGKTHPDVVAEGIRTAERATADEVARAIAEAEAKQIAEINATIRAELTSESWLARNWRPLHGLEFTVEMAGFAFLLGRALYIGGPVLKATLAGLSDLSTMLMAYGTLRGAILGVQVWGRSQEKVAATLGGSPVIAEAVKAAVKAVRR